MDRKDRTFIKLHTIIRTLKPALNQESIFLSEDKLLTYGIRKNSMDLEQGGRFFKPMPQSDFEKLPRLEEYYDEDGWDWYSEWDTTPIEIRDAEYICDKLLRFLGEEIPDTSKDEWGCHRMLTDYTEWGRVL